jgi:hypothetical protein
MYPVAVLRYVNVSQRLQCPLPRSFALVLSVGALLLAELSNDPLR